MDSLKNVDIEDDEALIEIHHGYFDLDVIYSAAYTLLDKAYFSFTGDPEDVIEVNIKVKEGNDVEKIVRGFQNELVNYSVYMKNAERNKEVREAIIERALATNIDTDMKRFEELENYLSPDKKGDES